MSTEKTTTSMTTSLAQLPWSSLQMGQLIGNGGYGDVYKATWQGIDVAVKQLYLKTLSGDLAADFQREATLMAQCQFPHIVRLYGVCEEPGHTAMVMEYLPKGSLYQILHDSKETLPWNPIRWNLAIDVGKGLAYLHSQNIVHRDLKSLNVLLDNQYRAKIADFGLAKIKLETNSTTTKTKQGMGTTRWRAPELFKRNANPNVASDAYSYGMVLWEIASRQLPFNDAMDDATVISWIKDGEQENLPADCPQLYGELIKASWKKEPNERPSAEKMVTELAKARPLEEPKPIETKAVEKVWHIDPATPGVGQPLDKDYALLSASEKDIKKVMDFYNRCPVPGYEIGSVQVIYNPAMNSQFNLQIGFLQKRDKNPAFVPRWPDEIESPENKKWRQTVYDNFETLARSYLDPDYPAVKLLPMWHGTRPEILDSLFKTGYANLATTDSGFLGKGIYFAYEAEYSHRVYSQGALLLNWASCFSVYPIIDGDMKRLGLEDNKANYGNYDGHFAPVISQNPNNPHSVTYYPTKPNQKANYHELVVFQSAQCLPRYLVRLQTTLLKPVVSSPQPTTVTKSGAPKSTSSFAGKADYHTGNLLYLKNQYEQSFTYFEKAANQGYPAAYLRLWRLYEGDCTIVKNEQKQQFYGEQVSANIDWFQKEAKKGKADAQANLGLCYAYALGVPKDLIQAAKYYQLAADQGDARAQKNLGKCYKKGKGVAKDLSEAAKYYELAAEQGYEPAKQKPYKQFFAALSESVRTKTTSTSTAITTTNVTSANPSTSQPNGFSGIFHSPSSSFSPSKLTQGTLTYSQQVEMASKVQTDTAKSTMPNTAAPITTSAAHTGINNTTSPPAPY